MTYIRTVNHKEEADDLLTHNIALGVAKFRVHFW